MQLKMVDNFCNTHLIFVNYSNTEMKINNRINNVLYTIGISKSQYI